MLENLTVSPNLAMDIIRLGIAPYCGVLWNYNGIEEDLPAQVREEKESWSVVVMPFAEYVEGFVVPAWTKEEIDIMIGGEYAKPDMKARKDISRGEIPISVKDPEKYIPAYWVYNFPEKQQKFFKGADASAEVLIYALKNKLLFAADCNKRYRAFYKNENDLSKL